MKKYSKLLSRYGARPMASGWYRMRCVFPGHRDSTPSLDINPETGGYNCWGCGRKGRNPADVVVHKEKVNYATAYSILSDYDEGVYSSSSIDEKPRYLDPGQTLETFVPVQGKKYFQYLDARGVEIDMIRKFDLRQGNANDFKWNNRIIWGIYDDEGNLASIEGRALLDSDKRRYMKWSGSRAQSGIFGIDYVEQGRHPLLIVEGVFDAISMHAVDRDAVAMACSDISKQQVAMLKRTKRKPVVVLDGIKPGTRKIRDQVKKKITLVLARSFSKFDIIEIDKPDVDPNDLYLDGKLRAYLDAKGV